MIISVTLCFFSDNFCIHTFVYTCFIYEDKHVVTPCICFLGHVTGERQKTVGKSKEIYSQKHPGTINKSQLTAIIVIYHMLTFK